MHRDELDELHYITPIDNVPSILRRGILSHSRAERFQHESVALQEIQERRAEVVMPGGRRLHSYVNPYICARNPMLYRRRADHRNLCVLRVRTEVLDIDGVVVADRNASSDHVRFGAAPDALAIVDREMVFARYWTHPGDPIAEWRHKSIKCAEVLVPDRVPPEYIAGAYVSCTDSRLRLQGLAACLPVSINGDLFFL
jgi:acetyltransferase-like isoleucine patch superfamily enzyme